VAAVAIIGVAYGVAAGAVGPGLLMSGGDTDHVSCAGTRLTVEGQTRTGLDVQCEAGGAGNGGGRVDQPEQAAAPDTAGPTVPAVNPTTPATPATPATGQGTDPTTPVAPTDGSWWVPPLGNQPWQWEIDHPLDLSSPSDMGTDATLPDGQPAPDPVIYDIDGIENPTSTVTALHALGDHAICYVEVGTAGDYYSAADEGTPTTYYQQFQAAGVLGDKLSGYPEYFLNIDSPATVSIVESMIDQQCAGKGFDAVETDLDETYSGSDGPTGFQLTKAAEEQYLTTLADYMHGLGLGWIIKNPDDTGDSFAADMEPLADGVLTEQCNQNSTCTSLASYEDHKAIFNAEYAPEVTSEFCTSDDALGFNGAVFPVALDGGRSPCR
jgi:hypothetical protein